MTLKPGTSALILGIETATPWCGLGLTRGGKPMASHAFAPAMDLSRRLVPTIQSFLASEGLTIQEMDGIAVSRGPGSFTGLRIGVATAKTLAQVLDKPLIGVETMQVIAAPYLPLTVREEIPLAVTLKARRDMYYVRFFGTADGEIHVLSTADLLARLQAMDRAFLLGDAIGAEWDANIPAFPASVRPDPVQVALLGHTAYVLDQMDDPLSLTPLYVGRSAAEERRDAQSA